MFIATLIVVGGVITFVEVTKDDESASTAPTAAAPGAADFTGTYRADYGPGTDLDGKTVPGAPATTSNWDVRSECGASGCVATAASASGQSLLSSMTFDQLGGAWLAVGLASADCGGEQASEVWVVVTLQPQPDGTLTGETVRSSTDSLCAAKRAVKFTRTGDPDLNKVPDPAVLPPRVVTPADGLRGSYRQTTTFTTGTIGTLPGKVLEAETYCLRTGDRCMSLFHAGGGAVTLIFAKDKWTRNEVGTTSALPVARRRRRSPRSTRYPRSWTTRSRSSMGAVLKPLRPEARAPAAAISKTSLSAPATDAVRQFPRDSSHGRGFANSATRNAISRASEASAGGPDPVRPPP